MKSNFSVRDLGIQMLLAMHSCSLDGSKETEGTEFEDVASKCLMLVQDLLKSFCVQVCSCEMAE